MRHIKLLALPILFGTLACGQGESAAASFVLESKQCQLQSTAQIIDQGGGATSAGFNGCRFYYEATSKSLLWQFTTSGTTGSFLKPGAGWLSVRLSEDSPENSTLQSSRTVSTLPGLTAANEVVLAYSSQGDGSRSGVIGSVDVGSNIVTPRIFAAKLTADLSHLTLQPDALHPQQRRLSGSVSAATAVEPPPGTGGGGGGSGDCGSGCATTCTGTIPEMACYYCQAACLCRCAGEAACAQENAHSACRLGTCNC